MKPVIYDCEQRSEAWHALRLGRPTASAFDKIVTSKGKLSTQCEAYLNQLLAETILGTVIEEKLETKWMEHGRLMEPQAISSYEFEIERETQPVGFISNWDGAIGCSPDRLVGDAGLLELKSPAPQTHVGYLRNRSIEDAYRAQAQGQLLVSEREWLDLQSYCAGFPTVIIRVTRDEAYLAILETALHEFVDKLATARADLQARYGPFQYTQKPAEPEDGIPGLGITDEDLEVFVRARFPKETI